MGGTDIRRGFWSLIYKSCLIFGWRKRRQIYGITGEVEALDIDLGSTGHSGFI